MLASPDPIVGVHQQLFSCLAATMRGVYALGVPAQTAFLLGWFEMVCTRGISHIAAGWDLPGDEGLGERCGYVR